MEVKMHDDGNIDIRVDDSEILRALNLSPDFQVSTESKDGEVGKDVIVISGDIEIEQLILAVSKLKDRCDSQRCILGDSPYWSKTTEKHTTKEGEAMFRVYEEMVYLLSEILKGEAIFNENFPGSHVVLE